jgi:hypothetical protein
MTEGELKKLLRNGEQRIGSARWQNGIAIEVALACVNEARRDIISKAICQKWMDNEPEPCPEEDLERCLDTNKPCEKAKLVVSMDDVLKWFGSSGEEERK